MHPPHTFWQIITHRNQILPNLNLRPVKKCLILRKNLLLQRCAVQQRPHTEAYVLLCSPAHFGNAPLRLLKRNRRYSKETGFQPRKRIMRLRTGRNCTLRQLHQDPCEG